MTDPTTTTEAEAIAQLATAAASPDFITTGGARVLFGAYPEGWTLQELDLSGFEARPRWAKGTFRLADVDSFLAYIDRQLAVIPGATEITDAEALALPSIYLAPEQLRATAVFDDHTAAGPAWRDHLAVLQLQASPEWQAWNFIDRAFMPADEFAEHIEEWRHTIADPPTADLLDLVRNFRAVKRAVYGRDVVDKDGSVSLEWTEEVTASAGPNRRNGTLEIPEGFGLVMAPFDGAPPVNVPARFRYRVGDGRATFGVVLEQAAKIQRDAFDAEVERIRVHAPFVVMVGTPDTTA